jgi:diaminopimelate decarboxylase
MRYNLKMQTPRFEYSRSKLRERIAYLQSLRAPYGLTVRYAAKANFHPEIISAINESGMHFDASSSYEAEALLSMGIDGEKISLSSQQFPHNFDALLQSGVLFVATSFHQLELFLDQKIQERLGYVLIQTSAMGIVNVPTRAASMRVLESGMSILRKWLNRRRHIR